MEKVADFVRTAKKVKSYAKALKKKKAYQNFNGRGGIRMAMAYSRGHIKMKEIFLFLEPAI